MYFLTKYVLSSVAAQINFCMEVGLLPKKRTCTYCKKDLKLSTENCGKYVSIRDGTVFEASQISVGMVLRIIRKIFRFDLHTYYAVQPVMFTF